MNKPYQVEKGSPRQWRRVFRVAERDKVRARAADNGGREGDSDVVQAEAKQPRLRGGTPLSKKKGPIKGPRCYQPTINHGKVGSTVQRRQGVANVTSDKEE